MTPTPEYKPRDEDSAWSGIRRGLWIGLGVAAVVLPVQHHFQAKARHQQAMVSAQEQAPAAGALPDVQAPPPVAQAPAPMAMKVDWHGETASGPAQQLAEWVAQTRDNQGVDFVIVDKRQAKVYVFAADGTLKGATPVLLGSKAGDDSVPGIGQKAIADVSPEERTTPAGRFIGQRGMNAINQDVVWVDYDAAVSMHRVRTTNAAERRLERLATPGIEDNRISYGCINMPVAFFENVLAPIFKRERGVIYVLPEVKTLQAVFGIPDANGSDKPLTAQAEPASPAPSLDAMKEAAMKS